MGLYNTRSISSCWFQSGKGPYVMKYIRMFWGFSPRILYVELLLLLLLSIRLSH